MRMQLVNVCVCVGVGVGVVLQRRNLPGLNLLKGKS